MQESFPVNFGIDAISAAAISNVAFIVKTRHRNVWHYAFMRAVINSLRISTMVFKHHQVNDALSKNRNHNSCKTTCEQSEHTISKKKRGTLTLS